MLGALIIGRLAFVLINWSYFGRNTTEILLLYLGGFSWAGALIGGLLALSLTAAISQHPLGTLADAMLPLLGAFSVSAWLACWLDGCAYGQLTDAWWGLPAKDEWGNVATREPIQLLGAMLSASLIVILIWRVSRRFKPSITAFAGTIGLAAILFLLSFFRVDPSQRWQGLRYDSWVSIILLGISGLALFVALVGQIRNQPMDQDKGETQSTESD
jgi:phosphatidylglycerol:prolipoprotein diacylglycerol transferase